MAKRIVPAWEVVNRKPIFPGTSTMNQLDRIMEVTGRPSFDDLQATRSPFAETMLESLPPTKLRRARELFPTGSDQATDLMYNLLEFNPEKRLTAVEALRHPYLAQFHNPADEPSCDHIVTIPIDDNSKYTIQEYREKLYSEIVKRKKELRRRMRERERARELRWWAFVVETGSVKLLTLYDSFSRPLVIVFAPFSDRFRAL